jgi:IclR family acetate operon transcriptional repressor
MTSYDTQDPASAAAPPAVAARGDEPSADSRGGEPSRTARGGAGRSGAQSVDRTLQLLDAIGAADGPCTLSELAAATGLAAPTAHRLIASLVRFGYVRQEPSRRYTLGPRLVVLGERATRLLGGWAQPWLTELRDLTGETTNLAMLDGDEMVYLTQAAGRHQMRMFTEPGRRVLPHATAVGKALLARLPEASVRALLARTGMPAYTPATLTDPDQLLAQLHLVRRRGYAVDDEEQEAGVRCFAVALPTGADRMAISVSGPLGRISDAAITRFTPQLRRLATELGNALG